MDRTKCISTDFPCQFLVVAVHHSGTGQDPCPPWPCSRLACLLGFRLPTRQRLDRRQLAWSDAVDRPRAQVQDDPIRPRGPLLPISRVGRIPQPPTHSLQTHLSNHHPTRTGSLRVCPCVVRGPRTKPTRRDDRFTPVPSAFTHSHPSFDRPPPEPSIDGLIDQFITPIKSPTFTRTGRRPWRPPPH